MKDFTIESTFQVQLIASTPDRILRECVEESAEQWRYEPLWEDPLTNDFSRFSKVVIGRFSVTLTIDEILDRLDDLRASYPRILRGSGPWRSR